MPPIPSTYADSARLPQAHSTSEKLLPSRALNEVSVKVIVNPKLSQTSRRLVESINAARSSRASKALAAQKLVLDNSIITADSHKIENIIEKKAGWTKIIASKTKVKGQQFKVIVHTVRTNRIETANPDKVLAELQAQNLQQRVKVKFLRLTWKQKT